MKHAALFIPVAAALTVGCPLLGCSLQQFDADAASATVNAPPVSSDQHTVALDTPPIQVTPGDNGMTTDDACQATRSQALDILRINCAGCHGGGPGQNLGQPAFDYVLDVDRLLMAVSETVKDPKTMKPVRFLIPGDPDHSRVYARVFHGEMPPMPVVGLPDNLSRPTVSDVSVIRHWIAYCLGATPPPVGDGGTATEVRAPAPDGGTADDLDSGGDGRGQTLARSASQ
ncbi:MAG TPA: hypothetical protein VNO55_13040 [Polyangia bacterium]|nr:hypothetical protein [Polyangia bacterium]